MILDPKRKTGRDTEENTIKVVISRQELLLAHLLVPFQSLSLNSSLLQILSFWVSSQFLFDFPFYGKNQLYFRTLFSLLRYNLPILLMQILNVLFNKF